MLARVSRSYHDVTNCLRVVDLTFCNILEDEDEPLTIEVKAKTLGIEGNIANLQVSLYAPAVQPKFVAVVEELNKSSLKLQEEVNSQSPDKSEPARKSPRPAQKDERLVRQVRRMARARALQTAKHGELIKVGAKGTLPILHAKISLKHSYFRWDVIRELAEEAKVKGYATRAVDDAFFYAVAYKDAPEIYPWSTEVKLPFADEIAAEARTGLPLCSDAEKNHICFRSSWDYLSGEVPPYIRPLFLAELPVQMRMDIMWRRLSIIVYINIGKIVEALERVGIEARVPRNEEELGGLFIPTEYREVLSAGSVIKVRGGDLNEFANKIGFEFMSLEGFVSCVSQSLKATIEAGMAQAAAARATGS